MYASNIFDLGADYCSSLAAELHAPILVLNAADKTANIFCPYAFMIIFSTISAKFFRYE